MTKLAEISNKIILWGLRLTLIAVPLFFTTAADNLFTFPKALIFRTLVLILVAFWIVETIETKRFSLKNYKFILPIGVMLGLFIISTLFSVDPRVSFWGFGNRADGLYTFIHYVLFFLLFITHHSVDDLKTTIRWVIKASFFITIYGIFQHFGTDFIKGWTQDTAKRPIATLGNPLHLANYLIMVIPFTIYWVLQSEDKKERYKYGTLVALQILTLIYTLTRGGWLGGLASLFVFAVVYGLVNKKKSLWISAVTTAAIIVITVITLVLLPTVPNFVKDSTTLNRFVSSFRLEDSSSSARVKVLGAAFDGIKDSPIVGQGGNTFFYTFNKFFPSTLPDSDLQDYNDPHNVYVAWTVYHGIPGGLAFLFLAGYFIWICLQLLFRRELTKNEQLLTIAALASGVAYLVQSFFNIAYPTTYLYYFFILGIIATIAFKADGRVVEDIKENIYEKQKSLRKISFMYLYLGIMILTLIIVIITNLQPLAANIYSRTAKMTADFNSRIEYFQAALDNAGSQNDFQYAGELAETLTRGANYTIKQNKVLAESYLQQAIDICDEKLKKYPLNVTFLLIKGSVYNDWYELTRDETKRELSEAAFEAALTLVPNKPQIYWAYGDSLIRSGFYDRGIEQYQKAIDLEPTQKRPQQRLQQKLKQIATYASQDVARQTAE